MSQLLIGYARVSTEEQDLTAQRNALAELGKDVERGVRNDTVKYPHTMPTRGRHHHRPRANSGSV